jgi:hypothetical protein
MKILLFLWQFPQTLLALLLITLFRPQRKEIYRNRIYYYGNIPGGISLGEFVLLPERSNIEDTKNHEWGHTVQSRIFGPLYLLAVGIPSAVFNNLTDRIFHRNWKAEKRIAWYYGRYPEAWADKLGGVERK